ncbi:isoprenyl transferase [Acidaminococcus timonensis]|uniref:isoprenyl transferase n=1 Tax=Acidaminococcus timonensis TaxID=1871002 RepID=UPI0025F5F44B|nr:isoprenyl transferase [Acidaminococcus timonensis]
MLKKLLGLTLPKFKDPEGREVDLSQLRPELVPQHVAIIMDGNGRWARAQGKPRTFGHAAGARTLRRIVKFADKLGIKALSVYAFSTENWKRPITEVHFIMDLLVEYLTKELEEFNQYNVRIRFMGAREGLPDIVQEKMDHALEVTKNNTGIILNIAINYGGQRELVGAMKEIAALVKKGQLQPEDINEKTIEEHLYTRGLPAPDLLIRTGGDLRVSNFMLWQIAYSEFWTTPVYWPDFSEELLAEAVLSYEKRDRRFGGLNQK